MDTWKSMLAAIWAFGAGIRFLVAWWVTPTYLVADEKAYFRRAHRLLESGEFSNDGAWPPVQEVLLSLQSAVTDGEHATLRLWGALVGSLLIPLVFLVGRRIGGESTGLVAALVVAVNPELVGYSNLLWSESNYVVIMTCALVAGLYAIDRPAQLGHVAFGVALGVAALTREVGLVLALFAGAALLLVHGWKAGIARAAVVGLCAFAMVLPWTMFLNASNDGEKQFAPVARTSYLNLYIGAGVPQRHRKRVGRSPQKHYQSLGSTAREREAAVRPFLAESLSEQFPQVLWEKPLRELSKVFAPTSFVVRRIYYPRFDKAGAWAYLVPDENDGTKDDDGGRGRTLSEAEAWIASRTLVYLGGALMLLGAIGLALAASRKRPQVWLLLAFVAGHLVPTLLAFGATRFRVPLHPIFAVSGAWMLVHGRDAWEQASKAHRGAVVATAAIMLWLLTSESRVMWTPAWM